MKVLLGPLARSGLEARAGPDLPGAINKALVYYVGKLDNGRGPVEIPDFLKVQEDRADAERPAGPGAGAAEPRVEVEVVLDEPIEAALRAEAERQGVGLADLAVHVVLVYLAELDLIGESDPIRPPHAGTSTGSGSPSGDTLH